MSHVTLRALLLCCSVDAEQGEHRATTNETRISYVYIRDEFRSSQEFVFNSYCNLTDKFQDQQSGSSQREVLPILPCFDTHKPNELYHVTLLCRVATL